MRSTDHGSDLVQHLGMIWETPGLVFAVDEIAVGPDVEDSAAALDQLTFEPKFLLDCVRQTDGFWIVVSLYAVLDRDSHKMLLVLFIYSQSTGPVRPRPSAQRSLSLEAVKSRSPR